MASDSGCPGIVHVFKRAPAVCKLPISDTSVVCKGSCGLHLCLGNPDSLWITPSEKGAADRLFYTNKKLGTSEKGDITCSCRYVLEVPPPMARAYLNASAEDRKVMQEVLSA